MSDEPDSTAYFISLPFDRLCQAIGTVEIVIDDGRADFFVHERNGLVMIGQFGLRTSYSDSRLIISPIHITQQYRRQHFATRWIMAVLRWASECTRYIFAEIDAPDDSSSELAKKLGFSMIHSPRDPKTKCYIHPLQSIVALINFY